MSRMIGLQDQRKKNVRNLKGRLFYGICLGSSIFGILALVVLMINVFTDAAGWLDWQFLTGSPSRFASRAGIGPMILGSFFVMFLTAVLALPLGVGSAVYLEEYSGDTRLKRFLEINIANLAGVPSIVYGLLGLGIFVRFMKLGPGVVIVAVFTLTLRILPVIIVSTQEALRSVPNSFREAAYSLGTSQWETVRMVVLPHAMPSIMTGMILALANAIGETAPLIMVGVAATTFRPPQGLFSSFGALPLQIFAWSDFPNKDFQHGVVPAAIVTLLLILFLMNFIAVLIRQKGQKNRL